MGRIPRIERVAVVFIVAGRTQRKFGELQPAEIERAGSIEPVDHGRRGIGAEIGADLGAAGGQIAGAIEQVFMRQRHAVQR